jgi:hypothetical protein
MPDLKPGYNLIRMLLGRPHPIVRHCERSEAIQGSNKLSSGLLRRAVIGRAFARPAGFSQL